MVFWSTGPKRWCEYISFESTLVKEDTTFVDGDIKRHISKEDIWGRGGIGLMVDVRGRGCPLFVL